MAFLLFVLNKELKDGLMKKLIRTIYLFELNICVFNNIQKLKLKKLESNLIYFLINEF